MLFQSFFPIQCKLLTSNKATEKVNNFRFLGCNRTFISKVDVARKIERFNSMCGPNSMSALILDGPRKDKVPKDTMLKV